MIQLGATDLDRLSQRFWTGADIGRRFPEYLRSLYPSVAATVPLLETAERRSRELAGRDPLAAALAPYFAQHAEEERHHDVWLLEDIAALGLDPDEVQGAVAPADVAAMLGTQYFWILHAHPVALLGCFAVLEGSPMSAAELDGLVARSAIPREALRTLYKHAVLDPHHRDDLDALVDRLPLGPGQVELLALSALATIEHLGSILGRLVDGDGSGGVERGRARRRAAR